MRNCCLTAWSKTTRRSDVNRSQPSVKAPEAGRPNIMDETSAIIDR